MYLFSPVPNIICWLLNAKTNKVETLSTEIRIRNWGKLYRCSCLVLNTTISNNNYKYKYCYNLYTGESIDIHVILRKIDNLYSKWICKSKSYRVIEYFPIERILSILFIKVEDNQKVFKNINQLKNKSNLLQNWSSVGVETQGLTHIHIPINLICRQRIHVIGLTSCVTCNVIHKINIAYIDNRTKRLSLSSQRSCDIYNCFSGCNW